MTGVGNLIGVPPIESQLILFPDTEGKLENLVTSVRGRDTFIGGGLLHDVEAACSKLELELAIAAASQSCAAYVRVMSPYFLFSRGDKNFNTRTSPVAHTVVRTLEAARTGFVPISFSAFDLHDEHIRYYTRDANFEHFASTTLFAAYLKSQQLFDPKQTVVASPDVGGTARMKDLAKLLNLGQVYGMKWRLMDAVVDKIEFFTQESEGRQARLNGLTVILIDDILGTGGTLIKGVERLFDLGATRVIVCISHAILAGNAREQLAKLATTYAGKLQLITTNSLTGDKVAGMDHTILNLAPLFAQYVKVTARLEDGALSPYFDQPDTLTALYQSGWT
jgi:ribose-phosphate pyrophosphokinase